MSQVKDAGALEAGAEGLAEVVSAWDVPYQQLNVYCFLVQTKSVVKNKSTGSSEV